MDPYISWESLKYLFIAWIDRSNVFVYTTAEHLPCTTPQSRDGFHILRADSEAPLLSAPPRSTLLPPMFLRT